jgi:hypothetical protein
MDFAGPDPQDALVLPESPSVPPPGPPEPPAPPPLPAGTSAQHSPPLPASAAGGSILLFEPDRERLARLLAFSRRRVRAVLWLLVVGMALGLLWLIPSVHTFPLQADTSLLARALRDFSAVKGHPWWVAVLRVLGVMGPALAVVSVFWLPGALWREARLRRQSDLHLAVGRQGVLFFLPGQSQRWLLLPWGHIRSLSEETIRPDSSRRARLRTVLWRRLARLARLYRHGRRLDARAGTRRARRSPFAAHAALRQPRLALRIFCTGRLPVTGYHWLFRLAPFTPRIGPTAFRLETGWFAPLQAHAPAGTLRRKHAAVEASLLHLVVLALWHNRSLASLYPALPLPRAGGAFQLNIPGTGAGAALGARRVRLAAWAMLPLIPLLSLETAAQTLAQQQPLTWAAALNAGALSVLALGLALLLAGMQHLSRARMFLLGAALLALGGALNVGYGLTAFLVAWPWRFVEAPGQPFLAQEALAGLLIFLGALALALEGSGRPGSRPPISSAMSQPLAMHGAEVVPGVGLLLLGLTRALEDVNLALLSQSASVALQFLRNTLAEPLLPLAILGVCYFGPLANPALRLALRVLQAVYGLVLAVLVPVAFLLVQRALVGSDLPWPWLPLLALMLTGGLLAVAGTLLSRDHA